MQIKLEKYFMIFLGATLVSTSGKRERNTLTTSRELPAYEDAANPLLCPKESERCLIISEHLHRIFAAYPPFCLSC
jgi:hypothetical protein